MTITEAKQLVSKFPKQVGNFKRAPIKNLKSIVTVNSMQYECGNTTGLAIGDGQVYGIRLEKVESGGKVAVPNLEKVLA